MKISYSDHTSEISVDRLATLYLVPADCGETSIPLVFDTGASMTFINRTTAEKLHAVPCEETVTGGGNAGARFTANTVLIPMFKIGNAIIKDLKAVVVENEVLDFGTDDDDNPIYINGFLGWDVIQHFTWRYDTSNSCFHIDKPVDTHVLSNMAEWDNMPLVYALLDGEKALFGFDTGNTETTLGDKLYATLTNAQDGWDTFTGVDGVKEEAVRIAEKFEIQIGQHVVTLHQVSIVNRQVFPSENKEICGLLAADIIQGKSWTLDYFNRSFEISEC